MALPKYMADFETTTQKNDCRVWAYGIVEIGYTDVKIGNNIDDLMNFIMKDDCIVYFHNLKFDGEFIMVWLFEHGYKHTTDSKNIHKYQFNILLSDKGMFYSMVIQGPHSKVKIIDSLKILNFKVADIARAFNLPILKGEIDYDLPRPIGWAITSQERKYIEHDVLIVAKALEILFDQGLTKMTQGSNALKDFKDIKGKDFSYLFPVMSVEMHDDIKQSYKGGFTYLNPKFKNKTVMEGIVLDKNSMYPWVMKEKLLPHGEPEYYEGRYVESESFPLYIQMIRCNFKLKPDHIPTIQIKNPGPWCPTEYLTDSMGEDVVLTLCKPDMELFLEQYNVTNLEYIHGYMFRGSVGIFDEYIDKWYKVKEESTLNGNKAMRTLAKLMLNSLYGKFGTSPHVRGKIPFYSNGSIQYKPDEEKLKKPIYVPMASFITAYAREECIRSAQAVYDRFIYADTDSLHLTGVYPPNLDIDDTRLGAWKCEGIFKKAKYIRAKTYIEDLVIMKQEQINGCLRNHLTPTGPSHLDVKCAGMPPDLHSQVDFDSFQEGSEFFGKLRPEHVPGGIVLTPTTFKIKA